MSDSTEMYTVTEYLMIQKPLYFKVQEYYDYQLLKVLIFLQSHTQLFITKYVRFVSKLLRRVGKWGGYKLS